MSKYKREEQTLEILERENRALKSTNRSLLKQLKKLSRGYRKFLLDEEKDEKVVIEKKMCFECSGEYKEIIVANRKWRQCQSCGKKGPVKII